jgi:hypothetical protein
MYSVEDQTIFQKKISSSSSALKNKLSKKPALNMGTICSSETSVDFQRTIWLYILKTELFISSSMRISDPTYCFLVQQ